MSLSANYPLKRSSKRLFLPAYTMTELLVVLCVIGILILMVLPDQTSVIGQAKALEAQTMLNHVYALEKSHFYKYSKYTSSFDELGFEPSLTIKSGGQAVYNIEIFEAGTNSFKARATALSDFDGDGAFNTWEIDEDRLLKEVVKD